MVSFQLLFCLSVISVTIGIVAESLHRFYEVLVIVQNDVWKGNRTLTPDNGTQPNLVKGQGKQMVNKIVYMKPEEDLPQDFEITEEKNETQYYRQSKKRKYYKAYDNITDFNMTDPNMTTKSPYGYYKIDILPQNPFMTTVASESGIKDALSEDRNFPNFARLKATNRYAMSEEEIDEFIGIWVLLGSCYLIVLLCIQEIILSFLFMSYYWRENHLIYWIVARSCCFFINLTVLLLLCIAKIMCPPFPNKWELYVFSVVCWLITIGGVVEFSSAIILLRRRSQLSERS